jgi:16S rRNA (guanine527-N7)-methyltransferase
LKEVLDWKDAPPNGEVIIGRVEEVARNPRLEDGFDLVTARSFGPPSVTAECGVRFLKVGGLMIVSEPPDDSVIDRWSQRGLALMGLESQGRVRSGSAFQILLKIAPTPPEFPRGIGTPRKKPIF